MASFIIKNYGDFSGTMDAEALSFSTDTAEVTIVTGITATKTADKTYWVNGELTYVVILTNDAENAAFEGGTFVDTLDSRITLVTDSVLVKGVAQPYTFVGNVLTVANLPTVNPGSTLSVLFKVVQV